MDLSAGSLETHQKVYHGVGLGELHNTLHHPPLWYPQTYRISFLRAVQDVSFPGEGFKLDLSPVPICAPTRAGNNSGPGGGKPPPPAFPILLHVSLLGGFEQETHVHVDVSQQFREEVQAAVMDV